MRGLVFWGYGLCQEVWRSFIMQNQAIMSMEGFCKDMTTQAEQPANVDWPWRGIRELENKEVT